MKDISISIKQDGKNVTLVSLKDGWKVGFSPAFKKELIKWFKDPAENWLNFTYKEWEPKPEANQHSAAKSNGYQPDDEIAF